MAKQTPMEKYISKVEGLCLEHNVALPSDEGNIQAWRDAHAECRRVAARTKAQDSADLTTDKAYRQAKRTVIRANTEDRLTVQTELAETVVLARLQRERIETELREKLGMTKEKPVKTDDNGVNVETKGKGKSNNAQSLPA
jgi:hypothetical protein